MISRFANSLARFLIPYREMARSIPDQWGRDFPTGGMNETGLVVETMMLPEGKYPASDSRLRVKSFQWRRYHLDNHSTVDEVIASDSKIRILPYRNSSTVHFLVSDKTGKCAAIEFLDGKMVVYTGDEMPVTALSNSMYTVLKPALSRLVRIWH